MKQYRHLIQYGTFYRLLSPFEGNETAWMVVSEDKTRAIVGYYKVLQSVNGPYKKSQASGAGSGPEVSCRRDGARKRNRRKLNELLALVIDQPELNTKEELLKHLG